jgi:hypothetical protein
LQLKDDFSHAIYVLCTIFQLLLTEIEQANCQGI